MASFPCPNPTCSHAFTTEQVRANPTLKCPGCGKVFTFRQRAPVPPPLARPVQAQPVVQAPEESPFDLTTLDLPRTPVQRRPARQARQRLVYAVAGSLAGIAVLLGLIFAIRAVLVGQGHKAPDDEATEKARVLIGKTRNLKNVEEKAFKLVLADKAWLPDNVLRQRLGVLTAWKCAAKDGWMAVAAKDYGQYQPREAELLRVGAERLEKLFDDSLEWAEKPEATMLGEASAERLLFKGQLKSVVWTGYMYLLTQNGFGYWLYAAAPTKEEADELLTADLQGAFFVDTDRQGWRPQPPKLRSFTTADSALTITAPEGMFEKHAAKDQDPRAELYLFARYQKDQDNRKNADVLVLTLAKEEDLQAALTSAKKYLEEKKQEENKDYKIAAGEGQEAGGESEGLVGNRPGLRRSGPCYVAKRRCATGLWLS